MKRLLLKLTLFIPLLALVSGINYSVDPANIFFNSRRLEKTVAENLLAGKPVVLSENYNERLLQRFYADGLSAPKGVLAIGSSRALGISGDLFPGLSFFNCSVSGATVEDLAAIYQIYRQRGLLPGAIVLSLEPWMLNRNNGQFRWKYISDEYVRLRRFLDPQGNAPAAGQPVLERYAQLISPSYFQESVRVLIKNIVISRCRPVLVSGEGVESSEGAVKMSDGSLRYDKATRNRSLHEVNLLADSYRREQPVYSLGKFDRLDPELIHVFEKLVALAKADGVKLVFFFPAYHPLVYRSLSGQHDYSMVAAAEDYFLSLAKKERIPYFGSFDPGRCGLVEGDFYDGMHMKPPGYRKVLQTISGSLR